MKLGIVTFWQGKDNYGQVLQLWAMQYWLKKMGHKPFLIRYVSGKRKVSFVKKLFLLFKLALKPTELQTYMMWRRLNAQAQQDAQRHDRKFEAFIKNHVELSPVVGYEELKSCPPEADAYLCGSDQIWGGNDAIYYLQFGDSKIKRIAYAPSFGGLEPNKQVQEQIKKYLSNFTFISSRENKGVNLLRSLGYKDTRLVPDPTLLLPASEYKRIESENLKESDSYILLYLLGNEISLDVSTIFDFASQHGLKVKYVASQGRYDDYSKIYPTIEEWLELVDNASYVITNSFHGTVFSLIFNTPFIVIPISGVVSRMNNRVYDMLEKYGLRERIYKDSLTELFLPIDFSNFNKVKENEEKEIQSIFVELLSN